MIRVAALSVLALAACSKQEAAAPVAPQAVVATQTSSVAPVDAMRGEVSALVGARSDLAVRVTDFGTVVDLPADALFDYDKADLTPAAAVQLAKAADLIRRSPAGALQVIGHTDSHGADAYNQALSLARAETVAAWLRGQVGVRTRAIAASGKGETAPIAPNETPTGADNPQGRQKNRRVEIVIPKA